MKNALSLLFIVIIISATFNVSAVANPNNLSFVSKEIEYFENGDFGTITTHERVTPTLYTNTYNKILGCPFKIYC